MKEKIQNRLGKLLLAASAVFWSSCSEDNSSSASTEVSLKEAKIDVGKIISDVEAIDTTGLMGQSIDGYEYCNMVDIFNQKNPIENVRSIAENQLLSFFASEHGSNIPPKKKNCLQDILNDMIAVYPEYGALFCTGEDTQIDEKYINAMVSKHESFVDGLQKNLEKYNQQVDLCDKQ